MSDSYIKDIIEAIKASEPRARDLNITPDMHLYDIPGMDSMSIVNLQIQLSTTIGEKANAVLPMMEMTITEYSEILMAI